MRRITLLKTFLLTLALLVGNAVWGATGDVVYTLNCGTGQPFGTSNAYALKTGTLVNNLISVDWTVTLGSVQSASAFWVGSNSSNKSKLTLGTTYQAIGVPNNISATDTYVSAIIAGNNLNNIGKITISNLSIAGGSTTPEVYIVHSVDNGTTYTSTTSSKTAASAGTLTFEFTTLASARYAIIIKGTNDYTFRVPIITFYEGASSTTVSTPTISASGALNSTDNYFNTASITLSSTTAGADIRYTTNGEVPTASSMLYSAPFDITSTSTIKAIAIKSPLTDSDVAQKTITITAVTAPTITVTQVSVPDMTAVTGLTDSEILTATGTALTANVAVTIDGTNASMFSVAPESLTNNSGAASGSVTVTYSPTAPGTHTATLRFNSAGATEVIRTLNGTSAMATPVATDATGISTSGFNANWNAVAGATEYELSVVSRTTTGTPAADLFFSEYIEGSSNNKAIEIFNGTGAAVDLSTYTVEIFSNGGLTAQYSLALTGTVANNDVYVIYNTNANTAIKDQGDVASDVTFYNGDDAVVLKKNGTIIDIFGRIGEDPGASWTATGGYTTVEKTLVRKSTVVAGISVNPASGFPTLATEWDLYNQDESTNLGSHTFSSMSVNASTISGSPFTVTGSNTKAISGLAENTNYYYKVIAKNGSTVTAVSNEITVITSNSTDLHNATQNIKLHAINGNIVFNTTAGRLVNIYNSLGQRVSTAITTEGNNTIPARVRGVIFVKIGSEISKLIVE